MRTKLLLAALAIASVCNAKDIKTVVVTTTPEMHCSGCEKKIKDNIRFEKGIKDIRTNLDDKTVTIDYDADKTSVEAILKAFRKIKYEACEVKPAPQQGESRTDKKQKK